MSESRYYHFSASGLYYGIADPAAAVVELRHGNRIIPC